jgi:hypothetical protein
MTRHESARAGEGEVTIERIRMLAHRPDDEPKGVDWLEPFRQGQELQSGSSHRPG